MLQSLASVHANNDIIVLNFCMRLIMEVTASLKNTKIESLDWSGFCKNVFEKNIIDRNVESIKRIFNITFPLLSQDHGIFYKLQQNGKMFNSNLFILNKIWTTGQVTNLLSPLVVVVSIPCDISSIVGFANIDFLQRILDLPILDSSRM